MVEQLDKKMKNAFSLSFVHTPAKQLKMPRASRSSAVIHSPYPIALAKKEKSPKTVKNVAKKMRKWVKRTATTVWSAYPDLPIPKPKKEKEKLTKKEKKAKRREGKTTAQIIDFGDDLAMIFSPLGASNDSPPQKPEKLKEKKLKSQKKKWAALD